MIFLWYSWSLMYCHKLHTHACILTVTLHIFCTEFWLQIKISIAPRFYLKLHSLAMISHTDRQTIPNTQCMANDKTNHNVFLVQQKCQSFTKKKTQQIKQSSSFLKVKNLRSMFTCSSHL